MSSKKQRRLDALARRKEIEDKVAPMQVSNPERDYESDISHSHELEPNKPFVDGVAGPDIPEPKEYDPY